MSLYRQWIYLTLISGGLFCCIPEKVFGFSNYSASEVLGQIQSGDGSLDAFTCLESSQVSFAEGRQFLLSLIQEINTTYHLSLNMSDACRVIRENLHLMQVSAEVRDAILQIIHQIEFGPSLPPENLSEKSGSQTWKKVDILGYGFYWPWEWSWFGLNNKQSNGKSSSHVASHFKDISLELPPKMAAGFACALGGALLCIVPGGQTVGLTLIGTGLGLALDGIASGERPYYINSVNGEKVPEAIRP